MTNKIFSLKLYVSQHIILYFENVDKKKLKEQLNTNLFVSLGNILSLIFEPV